MGSCPFLWESQSALVTLSAFEHVQLVQLQCCRQGTYFLGLPGSCGNMSNVGLASNMLEQEQSLRLRAHVQVKLWHNICIYMSLGAVGLDRRAVRC